MLIFRSGIYEDNLHAEGDWRVILVYTKSGKLAGRIRFNPKMFPKSNPDFVETSIENMFMDNKGRIHAEVSNMRDQWGRDQSPLGEARYIIMDTKGVVLAHGGGGPDFITADGVGYMSGPGIDRKIELKKYWIDEK